MWVKSRYRKVVRGQNIQWDIQERMAKAREIFVVLSDAVSLNQTTAKCLDIGCGSGVISDFLGSKFGISVGFDTNLGLLKDAICARRSGNTHFVLSDGLSACFKNNAFDVIICNQVYEHVPDAHKLMREVHRMLKPDGVCYFARPNKVYPVEPHRFLPFLHWLPRRIANTWLRILGDKRPYDIRLRSYWGLRSLLKDFDIEDYTLRVVIDASRFVLRERTVIGDALERIPPKILRWFLFLSPAYIYILRKRQASEASGESVHTCQQHGGSL